MVVLSATALAALTAVASITKQVALQATGSAIGATEYSVTVNFQVSNFYNQRITTDFIDIIRGEVYTAPINIDPSQNMQFATRKSSWGMYGSIGVVTFNLDGRILFIYWQVPLTAAGGVNELAIGLGHRGYGRGSLFNNAKQEARDFMSAGFGNRFASYDSHSYGSSVRTLQVSDDKFVVTANMGTTKQPYVTVNIAPLNTNQFASNLQQHIY